MPGVLVFYVQQYLLLFVDFGAVLDELDGLGLHTGFECFGLVDFLSRSVLAHVLRDLHRAEVRAAHRAEVSDLGRILGQGFVVERRGFVRIQTEVELFFPT